MNDRPEGIDGLCTQDDDEAEQVKAVAKRHNIPVYSSQGLAQASPCSTLKLSA